MNYHWKNKKQVYIPARVNDVMALVTTGELPELHPSRRIRWRISSSTTAVGSSSRPWPGPGPVWRSIHKFPTQQPGFLTQRATVWGVVGSVNNPASVSMNNVFEAAYRAARGTELRVSDRVFRRVVDSRALHLFAGQEVLDLVPWGGGGWRLLWRWLLFWRVLLAAAFWWWWWWLLLLLLFLLLLGLRGLRLKSEKSHKEKQIKTEREVLQNKVVITY